MIGVLTLLIITPQFNITQSTFLRRKEEKKGKNINNFLIEFNCGNIKIKSIELS